jgi:hypothetical protein
VFGGLLTEAGRRLTFLLSAPIAIALRAAAPCAATRARSAPAGPRAQARQQPATMRPDATATVLVEGLPSGHIAVHVLKAGDGHLNLIIGRCREAAVIAW